MRRELLGLLAVASVVATACSAPTSRGSEQLAGGEGAAGFGEAEPAPVPAQPARVEAAPPSSLTLEQNLRPTSTSTTVAPRESTTTAATVARPAISSPPTTGVGPLEETENGAESSADEPVFEADPLPPLDLSAGRRTGRRPTAPDEQEPDVPTGWAAFDQSIHDQLLRNGNTAVSVAVSIGGDVVHSASFGTRVPGTLTAMTTADRFRIASISKTITAITLLQLVQEGVVGLDEPIGAQIAAHLGVTNASAGSSRLTVRSLLTHTTGYGKYYGTFFGKGAQSCHHAGAMGVSQGGGGGGYTYSNMNYCLAGLAIETLTGRTYEEVVYEKLLTPLGLSGLRLPPTFDPGPGEVQHVSTPGRNYMETLGGAGSWITSPIDLVTIFDALDPATPGWAPLTDATMRQMLTPTHGQYGQRGYGMGMILYGGGRYGHTGTIENTHAMVQNRGDGVIWSVTVAGPYPDDTPRLESVINRAFEEAGFVAG